MGELNRPERSRCPGCAPSIDSPAPPPPLSCPPIFLPVGDWTEIYYHRLLSRRDLGAPGYQWPITMLLRSGGPAIWSEGMGPVGVLGFLAHDVLVDKADRQPAVPHKVVPVCREMLPLVRLPSNAEPAGGSSYASTSKSRIAEESDSGVLTKLG